jgi:predicted RNase H-like nuclease
MITFLGIDLGWYGKPSGVAAIQSDGRTFTLSAIDRIEGTSAILTWIESHVGSGPALIAVDAPLVIRNRAGIRPCERELNRDFQRYHAGCHPANLGRPFAKHVVAFSKELQKRAFVHGAEIAPKNPGRYQIEVHPHAASVRLFNLPRIVKYKRGRRAERAAGLRRLRGLLLSRLPLLDPSLHPLGLPSVPRSGPLKPAEDQIDAVLCAYIAAHYWYWGTTRNRVYGTARDGYVVVPFPPEPTSAPNKLPG